MSLPKITNKKVVAQSRLFRAEELHLEFSNGEKRVYERLMTGRKHAVMIVPMLDKETFLLIREYSVGVENYTLGFPKGLVEEGESLFEGANRELKEEVGKGAQNFTFMRELMLSPNYMQHKIQVVLAESLYDEKLEGDEPEPLDVIPWKLSDIDQLLERPDFIEARSLAALLLLERSQKE